MVVGNLECWQVSYGGSYLNQDDFEIGCKKVTYDEYSLNKSNVGERRHKTVDMPSELQR